MSSLAALLTSETIYRALDEWRNGKNLQKKKVQSSFSHYQGIFLGRLKNTTKNTQVIYSPSLNTGTAEYKEATRFRFHENSFTTQHFYVSSVHQLKVQSLLFSKFN